MRRAARRDANERELIEAARKVGFTCFQTGELADWVVQRGNERWSELWEVKGPLGKLTPAQIRNRERGLQVRIVRSVEDVLQARKEWLK